MTHNYLPKKFLPIVLIAIIGWLGYYSYQATQIARLPFGDTRLIWYHYLAIQTTDCTDCPLVQYFRDAKPESTCMIQKATLSSTMTDYAKKDTHIVSIEEQSLQAWVDEKWEKKYPFDASQYDAFEKNCLNKLAVAN